MKARLKTRLLLLLVAAALGFGSQLVIPKHSVAPSKAEQLDFSADIARVEQAFAKRQSKIWLTLPATVDRLLADDNKGIRHQKFIVKVANLKLLVAHNIDLAPRVPISLGEPIVIRGRYEWNAKGGVLHWTHRDPNAQLNAESGYIKAAGKIYH